jgi:hypothetical protein
LSLTEQEIIQGRPGNQGVVARVQATPGFPPLSLARNTLSFILATASVASTYLPLKFEETAVAPTLVGPKYSSISSNTIYAQSRPDNKE